MKASKIVLLSAAVLVTLSIILLVGQLLSRKAKNKSQEGAISLSYGIWLITFFLSGALLTGSTVPAFAEAIDIIYKTDPAGALSAILKTGSLLIGITILWLIVWYYLANTLSVIVIGKRSEIREFESDNYVFFLIRGIVLIGLVICLLPIFGIILALFIPKVDIPFYH